MSKTRIIQIRVSRMQYERIQLRKESKGYLSLSQFIRDLALKEDLSTEKMIREIHQTVTRK